jgi:MFS transporter, PPP family, 3-phenylpropionic acid transporter
MKHHKMAKYFLAYVFIGLAVGSYLPILSTYLKNDLNFKGSQVGAITAVTILVSIFTLPIWGYLTDKIQSPKKTLLISLVVSSILIAFASVIDTFGGFIILISVFMMFRAPVFSLYDEILVGICKQNKVNFGTMRIGGSLGYASSLIVGSFFTRYYGNHVLFLLSALFFFIVATVILISEDVDYKAKEPIHLKVDLPILFKNKTFWIVVLIHSITIGVLDSNMTYMSTYLNEFSQSDQYLSIAVFLSAIIELPVLYSTKFIYRKISFKPLFIFLTVLNLLRYLLLFLFPTKETVLILAPLHGVTFGLGYPIMIQFIKDHVRDKVLATALTLFNALLALFTAVFNFFSGMLIDVLTNMHYLFIFYMTIYLVNGFIIMFGLKNHHYKAETV